MNDTGAFVAGHYRHYKGQHYEVVLVANHSETEEPLVIYRCLYGDFSWWARPLAMFAESVLIDGESVPPICLYWSYARSGGSPPSCTAPRRG